LSFVSPYLLFRGISSRNPAEFRDLRFQAAKFFGGNKDEAVSLAQFDRIGSFLAPSPARLSSDLHCRHSDFMAVSKGCQFLPLEADPH